LKEQAAARSLESSSIGKGGLRVKDGGSIIVEAGGDISLDDGDFNATNITAASTVSGATVSGSTVVTSGNVVAASGTLVSLYARNHQVATGYVSAWIDVNGNVLATASARKFKRDFSPYKGNGRWRGIRGTIYRLRAAWILADIEGRDKSTVPYELGVIADDMVADYPELVVFDKKGEPWSFHYERLSVVAIDAVQEVDGLLTAEIEERRTENDALRAELAALTARVAALES
jgi:hypothetical protein